MEYNSVPIFPYSILIEPVGPTGNCLDPESVKIRIPDPEILKSGFFESCRACYGFRYVPMKPRWVLGALDQSIFTDRRDLPEENGRAYFEMEEVYSTPFGA